MTSAYAPYNVSYADKHPYLTIDEYKSAPTALDLSNLLPGGSIEEQDNVLHDLIRRASSSIDGYMFGAFGTLTATVNTENARVWANRQGQIIIHPKYWPILEIQTFSFGVNQGLMQPLDPSTCTWIEPLQFVVQQSGALAGFGLNNLGPQAGRGQFFCEWTYVNGWVNTTLAASVNAGDTTVTPTSVIGIYPGSHLLIPDIQEEEGVEVASTYVPGAAVVPLVAPLVSEHDSGTVLANLPNGIKEAAILWVSSLIKERGSGGLQAATIGDATPTTSNKSGDSQDRVLAKSMLDTLKMQFVAY